jgi:hypothetical protein
MINWADLLKVPVNLISSGAFFRAKEIDLNAIDPAKRDLAYLHHEAQKIGLNPTDYDEQRFIEHVGKLGNDGIGDDEARDMAFKAIYKGK